MAEYDWITVSKHNIPVAEFKRLEPVMKESKLNDGANYSYYSGTIEVEAGNNTLVITLFSEDIKE